MASENLFDPCFFCLLVLFSRLVCCCKLLLFLVVLCWSCFFCSLFADVCQKGASLLLGSGGPGSGKTTLISRLLDGEWDGRFANATLVFDCTLSHFEVLGLWCDALFFSADATGKASARTLEVFLSHRWKVDVVHVYRKYERAVKGVLDRAAKEGRYVGLGPGRSMSTISTAAQDVFWRLQQRFAGRANL
jgi:hypothetical protein